MTNITKNTSTAVRQLIYTHNFSKLPGVTSHCSNSGDSMEGTSSPEVAGTATTAAGASTFLLFVSL